MGDSENEERRGEGGEGIEHPH